MCCLRPDGRGHKCPSNVTAVRPPASVNGGAAGNGPSVKVTPIIARTRHGHSEPGRKPIPTTGATIGEPTRNTARAIATLADGGSVSAGSVRLRWSRRGLQRWTRRCRIHAFLQELIGSSRRPPRSLQRWTRGWWKSLWYQGHTDKRGRFARRGRDRGLGAALLALPAWTRRGWILIFIVWSCALPALA
jgi:hypothetical protein